MRKATKQYKHITLLILIVFMLIYFYSQPVFGVQTSANNRVVVSTESSEEVEVLRDEGDEIIQTSDGEMETGLTTENPVYEEVVTNTFDENTSTPDTSFEEPRVVNEDELEDDDKTIPVSANEQELIQPLISVPGEGTIKNSELSNIDSNEEDDAIDGVEETTATTATTYDEEVNNTIEDDVLDKDTEEIEDSNVNDAQNAIEEKTSVDEKDSEAAATVDDSDFKESAETLKSTFENNEEVEVTKDNKRSNTVDESADIILSNQADEYTIVEQQPTKEQNNGYNTVDSALQEMDNMNDSEAEPLEEIISSESKNAASSNFIIKNGVLIEYRGSGGSITVPSGVKVIGKGAFSNCHEELRVLLPASTTIINPGAFENCSGLSSISLNKVREIGEDAFYGCSKLKSIKIPNGVNKISDRVFQGCISLKTISLPEGIISIENHAFGDCTSLTTIKFPESLTDIVEYAFSGCSSLETVVIPKKVNCIKNGVFEDCSRLTSITLPAGIVFIGYHSFSGCNSLKKIVLPAGTERILEEAFYNCVRLSSITIPASVTEIEDNVFRGCYSVSIRCPANAKYVIDYAKRWEIRFTTYIIPVKKITLSKAAISVGINKSNTIKAKISPSTATDKTVTWKSSNTKIAKVNSSGKITGIAKGSATITAVAKDGSGIKANCKVTVFPILTAPGNCHFVKWNNVKYTGCRISWKKVSGADGYQTALSWTNGSHASWTNVKANVLYRDCTVAANHVSQMKVRAFYTVGDTKKYGPWSNIEYITPSPTHFTTQKVSSSSNKRKIEIKWNIVYGCSGYNVFITTNPNGEWYWNQSTSVDASCTNAIIEKYRGANLKKDTKYYVRIVTRRKRNGVFCSVPMPASNTNIGYFVFR